MSHSCLIPTDSWQERGHTWAYGELSTAELLMGLYAILTVSENRRGMVRLYDVRAEVFHGGGDGQRLDFAG